MKFRLHSEIEVAVEAFYTDRTYAGLLLGSPNAKMNEKILNEIPARVERIWGKNRALHLIKPEIRHHEGAEILPLAINFVWLDSDPIQPDFDGSSLIVAFFSPNFFDQPLGTHIANKLQDIDWKALARDYHF